MNPANTTTIAFPGDRSSGVRPAPWRPRALQAMISLLPETWKQAAMRWRWRLALRRIHLGADTRIDHRTRLASDIRMKTGAMIFGSRIGPRTYFGEYAFVIHAAIGSYCSIAPRVIIGGGVHPTGRVSTSPFTYNPAGHLALDQSWAPAGFEENPETIVGHDVWIGYGAIVLPGVRVGNGAIIAAGAVITRDVPPYTLVAGVPARAVRTRFPAADIAWLEQLQWWTWPEAQVRRLLPHFSSPSALREALRAGDRRAGQGHA